VGNIQEHAMHVETLDMGLILFDEEFNCRGPITPYDVTDLAKDILKKGLIQPVVVIPLTGNRAKQYPGKKYLLIAGYRRFTAFKINKATSIPCVIKDDIGDEADARIFNLSENLQRKQLNMLQESKALAKLEKLGITEHDAGERLGMSRGWVQVRYMVLRLPEEVQEEVAAGWLTQKQIRDAYSHFKDSGKEACFEVIRQFKDDKIKGRKGTRKKVKKKTKKDVKRARDRNDMFELQEHVYKELGGNSVITRVLAWSAGEISDADLHISIREFAVEQGKSYKTPE